MVNLFYIVIQIVNSIISMRLSFPRCKGQVYESIESFIFVGYGLPNIRNGWTFDTNLHKFINMSWCEATSSGL